MKLTTGKYLMLAFAVCLAAHAGFAQPVGGGPGGGAPPVPISGIEWLLLAGGMFGFRKIYQKYRNDRRS